MEEKFETGQIVATPGAMELAEKGVDLAGLLRRHQSGDWGDLCDGDKNENEMGLTGSDRTRLMSAYETEQGKLWIITEIDRDSTTLLLPEEY